MKRVLKTRVFTRWMKKTDLTNQALIDAIVEFESGLWDADLGGHVYKKRVALPGRGKSGSTRTLIAVNKGDKCFFMYGFQKNEKGNISKKELEAIQKAANDYLKLTEKEMIEFIQTGLLEEIHNET